METLSIQNRYELKELELNALLEVTQAINNNMAEEALYKIYNFTLRANLNIRKLALFVLDVDWRCKVNFGTETDFFDVELDRKFLAQRKPMPIEEEHSTFNEFDYYIPVAHKAHLLAMVFVGGVPFHDPQEGGRGSINFIQALSNIILVAIENKKLARRQLQQEAFRKELEIAHQVQKYLVPKDLPFSGKVQIAANYQPHHKVGGDYYDYLPLDDGRFLVCVADVSGKGIPAALLMSNFQASLRTLARKTDNLQEMVETLNLQIFESANGENFITVFLALYTPQTQTMTYINAGHNAPVLVGEEGDQHLLDQGTVMLGPFRDLPFLNQGCVTDLSSFLLFLYTDGLTEAFNSDEEQFGLERLQAFLKANSDRPLSEMQTKLLHELDLFRGDVPYGDDITILTCRYDPAA